MQRRLPPGSLPSRRLPVRISLLGLALGLVSLTAAAPRTSAAEPARPATRPAPIRSPEVAPDRQVTFRLRAPKASEVALSGQWSKDRIPLVQNTNGVWTATVGPVDPGVWEYSFVVDGLSLLDPANPAIKPMREPRTSILHLPGVPPMLHDFQEVPHGVVRQHTYASKTLGRLRELAVYTPPGYDTARGVSYPVLYLQHGSGDNHATWVAHGKAHWILDNLIAQGRARAMIVVMMDGHAAAPGEALPPGESNSTRFEQDLIENVIPFVEANYRTKPGSRHRALVGLSMGGEQALRIGLNHTDRFGWVGGFSAGTPSTESVAAATRDASGTNHRLKLLWIACGKDDFLLKRNQDFIALLESNGVRHEWHLTEGNHSWPVWRLYLADLAPRLFR